MRESISRFIKMEYNETLYDDEKTVIIINGEIDITMFHYVWALPRSAIASIVTPFYKSIYNNVININDLLLYHSVNIRHNSKQGFYQTLG